MLHLLLLLTGCDALFDVERHDLEPFRIAAIGVQDGEAVAAIWSGEGLYHSEAPTLEWRLNGRDLGEGWGLPVTGEGELELTATSPAGESLEAVVTVKEAPRAFEINRYAVTLDDLDLDARLEAEVTAADAAVEEGQALRVRLGADEGSTARWMTAMGQGTVLELEALSADIFAEEITFDDGELVSREPIEETLTHHLALVIDGEGGNRWSWIDAAFEDSAPYLRHEGRLFPVERTLEDLGERGYVAVTLAQAGGLAGVDLEDPQTVDDLSSQETLACAPPDEPFRIAWIAEGRCALPEVLGARVVVEVW